ncbi:maltase-glucoamylase, intestinal-like [Protopterus annectens]|uniref:maltase-glucoamylase, intestinal-like n=1 Tax=Protopterus annectens TaxID=7888 RepID=UPI001CFC1348|nr:maltase-glucoamylase, intestinal-like [Protopterus annectens]
MGKKIKYSQLEISLIFLFTMVVAISIALVVLLALPQSQEDVIETTCAIIPDSDKIDCFPESGASKAKCETRGCCWRVAEGRAPWCYFPKNYGYEVQGEKKPSASGFLADLKRIPAPDMFGNHITNLQLRAELQKANRFHFKITDPKVKRFEVPHEHIKEFNGPATSSPNYDVELIEKPFGIKIKRRSTGRVIFDTTIGPLLYSDQYLQLSVRVPSHNIYGLGEHVHQNYRHNTDFRTWPIFTRDSFPNGGTHNLYGHYTFFMCLEDHTGASVGVFLLNSNAMEITIQPPPAVTYRTIGGILDFYVFLADTPEGIVQEYLELTGKPAMPAYWTLGFHISRWGYKSLEEVEEVVKRNREIGIPYDVQFTDIDYMENKKIFTYDQENFSRLPQFAEDLHNHGQRYIIILDPAVATSPKIDGPYQTYERGSELGVWVNESDGKTPLLGEVWPGETVYPDYTNPVCTAWWVDECKRFYELVKYDGLWIDMNEISNFVKGSNKGCEENNLNYPPFTPGILDGLMFSKTLCMDAKQTWGNHYDVHSLYGYSMVLSTEEAIKSVFPNDRSIIFTRSSFAGTGKYSGHWLGDNAATWNDIKWAIPGMLEFNLFGIPYIGADICGFFDNCTEELCRRWMQVGAFYPFARNHNAEGYEPQDPAKFGANSALVESSRRYLKIRYTLLPYLYTLFYYAHTRGDTVVRPLLHEFFSDNITWSIDRQFLWGPAFLITPVLDPGTDRINGYMPDAVWYEYETGGRVTWKKEWASLYLPGDKIGLHLRGGYIFPTQKPDNTTYYSRMNSMGLIIALDEEGKASGNLYWDDGESRSAIPTESYIMYDFSLSNNQLKMQAVKSSYIDRNNLQFDEIKILGVSHNLQNVTVAQEGTGSTTIISKNQIQYDTTYKYALITGLTLNLGTSYTVAWTISSELLDSEKIDCYPDDGTSQSACEERGCLWAPTQVSGTPYCFYPKSYGYSLTSLEYKDTGLTATITTSSTPRFGPQFPSITPLEVDVTYLENSFLRFKIYDPNNKRYEVPVPLDLPTTLATDESKRLYEVHITDQPFGIQVKRKSTGTIIWNSQVPGFSFTDQYIEISTRLPSEYVYGFGENEQATYRHHMNRETYGLFAKDQPPGEKLNSYGVHPFYMGLEEDSNSHGVFLFNSNAMDITFLPMPGVTYRVIGGILDFFVFLGPTPELVVQQYTSLIGRPVLPAYWTLGFQLSRYGYENDTEISDLYEEMKTQGIPYDVQYADIDYMDRQMDFTLGEKFRRLPEIIDKMHSEGMRVVVILDPAIAGNETDLYPAFTNGVKQNVFIKWPNSSDIVWGKVWPDFPNVTVDESVDWDTAVQLYRAYAAFPDYFLNVTNEWWKAEIKDFYENMNIRFDGLWTDMNEPASFVHGSVNGCKITRLNDPPYMPALESRHMKLNHKTLCMDSQQHLQDGTPVYHYDVHNLYGWSQSKSTLEAVYEITGQRGVVVTRSTYPGSGKWVGHWLGDNTSKWDQLFKSIIGMLEFSLFGISYTGADICGYFSHATYELCARWTLLGAFYPYSRNHNGKGSIRQDPVAFNETFVALTRDVLHTRYSLLPYLYTLMFEAHSEGSTVVRPLLHEFVDDKTTWDIYEQFLWGPGLLISPALYENQYTVLGYFPNARWFDFYSGTATGFRNEWINMTTPLEQINLHIRGGYIIPLQEPANTTLYSRQNPMELIVPLDDNGEARGQLFWDDGQSIETYEKGDYFLTKFTAAKNTLSISRIHDQGRNTAKDLVLQQVQVWGINNAQLTNISVTYDILYNPKTFSVPINFDENTKVLKIDLKDHMCYISVDMKIEWS